MADIQDQIDYHIVYEQIDNAVDCYHDNFQMTFNNRESTLIAELKERATQLKIQIAQLKKLTSPETIEGLILKKKQQKQAQRLKLEMNWRELTDKLKKLEQEQKKLVNQNAQSMFDINNLKLKIQQLKQENQQLENKIIQIKSGKKDNAFITQPQKKSYKSPYKFCFESKGHQDAKQKDKTQRKQNIQRRLTEVKAIQKIPSSVLMQFLDRRDIKVKIFQMLR